MPHPLLTRFVCCFDGGGAQRWHRARSLFASLACKKKKEKNTATFKHRQTEDTQTRATQRLIWDVHHLQR